MAYAATILINGSTATIDESLEWRSDDAELLTRLQRDFYPRDGYAPSYINARMAAERASNELRGQFRESGEPREYDLMENVLY